MAMQFDLVAPERILTSQSADSVELPGAEGDFTVMADHAPVLTTLRPGFIKVVTGTTVSEYLVTGGFVEVTASNTSVLAEYALPKTEVTRDYLQDLVQTLEVAARGASESAFDTAQKRADDAKALLEQI